MSRGGSMDNRQWTIFGLGGNSDVSVRVIILGDSLLPIGSPLRTLRTQRKAQRNLFFRENPQNQQAIRLPPKLWWAMNQQPSANRAIDQQPTWFNTEAAIKHVEMNRDYGKYVVEVRVRCYNHHPNKILIP